MMSIHNTILAFITRAQSTAKTESEAGWTKQQRSFTLHTPYHKVLRLED